VRILGRSGTMNVDLILRPKEYAQTLPNFDAVLGGFKFNPGRRYSDYVSGDKVAEYGLTALIAGGAGALAVKTGLLAKFWKLIVALLLALKKLIIIVFAGIAALFRKIKNWITGRQNAEEQVQSVASMSEDTKGSSPVGSGGTGTSES